MVFNKTRDHEPLNQATIDHFGKNLRDKPEEESFPKLGDKDFVKAT